MKKITLLVSMFIIVIAIFSMSKVNAAEETDNQKLVYQDITINNDGSVTVKEVMWLNGEYNGSKRKIEFKDTPAYPFTGIYSNFSGDTDIYDATNVSNIKVFDISQSNFHSIEDMYNVENEFEKVTNASKGKYGVYTVDLNSFDAEVTIYCPSKKKKVFYLEYTINDAVVVHNDVAELYWTFLENETNETILDYQAIFHLPQEDNNVMVWSHGPASGKCSIVDNKTLSLTDTNIMPNKSETIRIMFNKELVPNATKKSNVNGKEYIIKYENAMADPKLAYEEKKKINIENKLGREFIYLDKYANIDDYNETKKLIERITWDDNLKQEYQKKLEAVKEKVNQSWKNDIEWKIKYMIKYNDISQYKIDSLKEDIDEGFDETAKQQYYDIVNELQKTLNERILRNKMTILKITVIVYSVLGIICIFIFVKWLIERKKFKGIYYRDFPNEDNAYIVDYLMNKKITSKTFSVTILDLIAKKRIKIQKNTSSENDIYFILQEGEFARSMVENTVIEILFKFVGEDNKCSLTKLKECGKNKTYSSGLVQYFKNFEKKLLKEVERTEYFKKNTRIIDILKILTIIIWCISFILGFFISGNGYISVLNYYLLTTILTILAYKILSLDKGRTEKGSLEYSKWLAHKRFLKHFGKFSEKELPEIALWDKYLVTATVLGCSDKVSKQMKLHISTCKEIETSQEFIYDYMSYRYLRQLDKSVNSLIHKARFESVNSGSSSSRGGGSYSSGSGFGGGSSSGGTGGGGGGWSRF